MSPNFLLIFACLVLGVMLRISGKFPKSSAQSFNSFVIWISLPAVVLLQVPALLARTELSSELLIPISMAWIQFALSFAFFNLAGRKLRWSRPEIGALILTGGLGNTSFVGFPVLESLFGPDSIRIGVLVDQPGSFLVVSTLGLVVASLYSPSVGRKVTAFAVGKRIASFPPFVALILGVVWHYSGTFGAGITTTVLERLAITLVPLALIAVGFQLKVSTSLLQRQWKPLSLGLGFKLVLIPLFFIGLYVEALGSHTLSTRITILESAMAPMITASVIADEFGLNTEIANLMVGIGIPLSLLTVYAWNMLPVLQGMN